MFFVHGAGADEKKVELLKSSSSVSSNGMKVPGDWDSDGVVVFEGADSELGDSANSKMRSRIS